MEYINLIATGLIYPAIYFISKHFASSYFNEKGKNLATKEDIADITREVKKVESMFSISTSSEIDYNSLKRNAIVSFVEALDYWYALIKTNQYQKNENYKEDNTNLLINIYKAKTTTYVKYSGLELYIQSENIDTFYNRTMLILTLMENDLEIFCEKIEQLYKTGFNSKETSSFFLFEPERKYLEHQALQDKDYKDERKKLIKYLNILLMETFKK